jgi:hypothetical protein
MTEQQAREVIPGGEQRPPWYLHLLPVARFLVEERGHTPIEEPEEFGWTQDIDGFKCHLTHRITDEDWAAINERFELPNTIGYFHGLIRDNLNRVDMMGHDTIISDEGQIPIEEWEAQQKG